MGTTLNGFKSRVHETMKRKKHQLKPTAQGRPSLGRKGGAQRHQKESSCDSAAIPQGEAAHVRCSPEWRVTLGTAVLRPRMAG